MQKTIFLILLTLLFSPYSYAKTGLNISQKSNYIDSISTFQQIKELMIEVDARFKIFELYDSLTFIEKTCHISVNNLHYQPWTKVDLDKNGFTDLVVIGDWDGFSILCIFDKGDAYEIKEVPQRKLPRCTLPSVANNEISFFFDAKPDWDVIDMTRKIEQLTLTFMFGDFIEKNSKPANHKVEKIEYHTTKCYGSCPVFSLVINSDQTARWTAEKNNMINNKEVIGSFKAEINQEVYSNIVNLLNYIDFESLDDNYAISMSDNPTSTLIVTYDHGKVKTIEDYGLDGTLGLRNLYQILFDLRLNQKWTK